MDLLRKDEQGTHDKNVAEKDEKEKNKEFQMLTKKTNMMLTEFDFSKRTKENTL